jgi:glutamate formiminotransferase
MMNPLVECIPNFSEGRRADVVQGIVDAIASAGAHVLDFSLDADHNRSVVTFVGAPEVVQEAMLRGARFALAHIDLTTHAGVHPRIGAVDVVPFVPLYGATMADCVALAHEFGRRAAQELNVPVYFYEAAALRPERTRLADVRRGGYEALRQGIDHDPRWAPDTGPQAVGQGGGMIVGARGPLIAFNAYLSSADLAVAQAVANALRESGGGLPAVRALGLLVGGRAQVSMNLTDYRITGLHEVMTRLDALTHAHGVSVTDTELIGLVPRDALLEFAVRALRLPDAARRLVLEDRIGAALGHEDEWMFE